MVAVSLKKKKTHLSAVNPCSHSNYTHAAPFHPVSPLPLSDILLFSLFSHLLFPLSLLHLLSFFHLPLPFPLTHSLHSSPSSHHHTYAVSRGADMAYTGNVRRLSSDSDYADIPLSPAGMHTAEEELGQSLEDLLGTEGHLTADDEDDEGDEEHTDDNCVTYNSAQPATLSATQASRGEVQSDSMTQEDIRPITPVSSTSTVSADQLRANSESPSQLYESVLVSEKNQTADCRIADKSDTTFAIHVSPVQTYDNVFTGKLRDLTSVMSSARRAVRTTVSSDMVTAACHTECSNQCADSAPPGALLTVHVSNSGEDTVGEASTESESVRCTAGTSVTVSSADNDSCSSAAGSKFLFYIE